MVFQVDWIVLLSNEVGGGGVGFWVTALVECSPFVLPTLSIITSFQIINLSIVIVCNWLLPAVPNDKDRLLTEIVSSDILGI